MQTTYPLFLASQSPRRKEILEKAGFQFEILTLYEDENYPNNMPVSEVPIYLAIKKLLQVKNKFNNSLIICADTVVINNGIILNKPKNLDDAKDMLLALKGHWHDVVTGVAIGGPDFEVSFSDITKVLFNEIKMCEIDYYLKNFKPLDKAGSYGIQEFIGMNKIEKIEGSFYNVMGLPIHKIYENLQKFIKFD